MNRLFLIILLLVSLNSYASVYLKVIYIADHYAACGDKKCLLVRDSPSDSFVVFNSEIIGFRYEEGYEYCLLLEIQKPGLSEPFIASDSLKNRYVLSEIKSKIRTQQTSSINTDKLNSVMIDSSKWLLYKLRMKDGTTRTFSVQKGYLQFHTENNSFSAYSDCNTISGDYSLQGDTIRLNNFISTKMACGKRSIEADFIVALNSALTIKVTKNMLFLKKGKTLLALFNKTKNTGKVKKK